jgi:hypothetical protein
MNSENKNINNKTWQAFVEDAGDGTGDGILTIPPELLEFKGWTEGTILKMEMVDGCLYLEESESQENNT